MECVNKEKPIKITLKGTTSLTPSTSSNKLTSPSSLQNLNAIDAISDSALDTVSENNEITTSISESNITSLQTKTDQRESILGYLEATVKLTRNEHFTAAHLLEEGHKQTRIELGHWDATNLITSRPVVENSGVEEYIKDWTRRSISKNLTISLPPNWTVKKAQCVNKDQHSHYEAEFWSDRCLGPETDQIESLSVVYQKICSKTDEDFEFTKDLYESMLFHKLSHEAFSGIETIIRNENITSKFGTSSFDSVARYHFHFVKRIGFAEVDYLLYIFKPKGLNVMLCAFIETSFGISEAEYNLVEYSAKSATIIYQ